MSDVARYEYRVDQCWPEDLQSWLNREAVFGWRLHSVFAVENRHFVVLERASGEAVPSTFREPHPSFGPPRTKGDGND